MAELLGTIASGISVATLAVQVGQSILKLKDCWSQVKEAPGTIKLQLRQLEQLHRILKSIGDNQAHIPGLYMPAESLEMCKDGADELSALVDELAEKLHEKRGWRKKKASLQAILKKDEMKRLKERLNEAIQILQLACCCQTNALLQRNTLLLETTQEIIQMQPNIILAEISKMLTNNTKVQSSQNVEDSRTYLTGMTTHGLNCSVLGFILGSLQVRTQYRRYKGKTRQEISAKYKLPAWLSNYVWDISAYRVFSGWQFTLKNYRVITMELQFIQCIINGDLAGVQNMLTDRTAFVNDRIGYYEINSTPLHIAADEGNLEICKLLLSEGADVLALDSGNQTPLQALYRGGAVNTVYKQINMLNLYRLFIGFGAGDALIEDVSALSGFMGCKTSLNFLQQQVYPAYYDFPIKERMQLLHDYDRSFPLWHNTPELIRTSLCPRAITQEVATYVTIGGRTLLHIATKGLVNMVLSYLYDNVSENCHPELRPDPALKTTTNDGWRILTREIIMAGALVTAIDEERRTPFQRLISEFADRWAWTGFRACLDNFHWHEALLCLINDWLIDLDCCGIDLQDYGKKEWELHCDYPVEFGSTWTTHLRVVNFAYGPRPEDWTFWFSEPTDELAGDFWNLIENPIDDHETGDHEIDIEQDDLSLPLPGAWVEDEYEDIGSDLGKEGGS